ncbi:MAG: thiamine pyrophosphate-dependent dehydrogenase E1 component subunit alpha [Chloroflexi bacterium]|nr:thiamine pyrophosphate-dependent dehydrogenase E1 component subunit alpha [Anaerolineaceae bacterium]NMB89612.1 thiamine pyrophosphate-dependent dehydrogenase E1 component subunit alpha [Chloroflexota bacterium]
MPTSISEVQCEFCLDEKVKRQLLKSLPREKLSWMLEKMYLTRYFEENAEALYIRGLVHGTMHLSIGMEASPVGSIAAIREDDLIIHHHRGHGHTIAKGADITLMMAEFIGKDPGYCRGRGGSMHIADVAGGNLGATGIVGAGLPTAVGIALALKMRKSDRVLLCFFGDGANNEGEFHEALNLASVWDLPVVFICDNNQYGMSMAIEKVMKVHHVADRAASYNIPGVTVDGNDVLAVYNQVREAIQYTRAGHGPYLVENLTYRWRGHSKSDRNLYRTPEEIAEWQKFDPIQRFVDTLLEAKLLSEDEIKTIDAQAKKAIADAAEQAATMPEPNPENIEDEVYAP